MIWYLLYPLRGTTAPPRLSKDHFIRKAFYRHGMIVAQHWLLAMLASVAVGVALSYPTVFLSDNPTAGFTSIPHHVWTTAKQVDATQGVRADVEMRQIWVHGSYMRALEKDVLKSALTIQQSLVGGEKLASTFPELGEQLKSSELSWGYHSPLMYWNNSAEAIDNDIDIVQTVNEQSRSSSSLNVALRPASVLAGKTFSNRKLVAADALVLTLLNKVEDGVGGKWQDKMHSLEGSACDECTLYPPHGEISRSRVYEFSFTPLSLRENIALAFAYGCMALYVLLSLRRLKAFHSRFGLVVTAITQITTSIVASFTICGMLKINLATIPQNAYPFIVLIIGIENMFRLINAILAYPPTMATDLRIANALGDVGPLSVATAAQNLIILWLLSTIVSPGVAAFCAYAIIATLFDSFFLLTFFVAVLNVDIRRLELQDSIARSNQATQKRRPSPATGTWFDALMHGRVPFSTRMAGSAVTTTFILSLNYHFFERKETAMKLRHLLGLFVGHNSDDLTEYESFSSPPMNATLTPGEWIRMQDFDTAQEVMRLVKPGAHNLVIRIFSPLIVVLSGADRTGVPQGMEAITSALRGFALHHFYPFAVVVVFVVAFVAVLMNFLLWNEASDSSINADDRAEDGLSVQHIELPHRLDVVKMASSKQGHFLTLGLDRSIAASIYDRVQSLYLVDTLTAELNTRLTWPVHNIAIDEIGDLLAFHCANDEVLIFSRVTRRFLECSFNYPDDHPPIIFAFENLQSEQGFQQYFIVLTSGGRIASVSLDDTTAPPVVSLSERPLLGASVIKMEAQEKRLFVVSEEARLQCFTFDDGHWMNYTSQDSQSVSPFKDVSGAVSIKLYSENGDKLLIVKSNSSWVYFVDAQTMAVVTSLRPINSASSPAAPSPILGQRIICDACGLTALQDLTLATEAQKTETLYLETRGPSLREAAVSPTGICIHRPKTHCNTINDAEITSTSLSNPGTWRALPSHAPNPPSKNKNTPRPAPPAQEDVWEAYRLSPRGEVKTLDLAAAHAAYENDLFVTKPGPTVSLDAYSIAVAFGNAVKILRASPPKLSGAAGSAGSAGAMMDGQLANSGGVVSSRRRGTGNGRKA
ncbi:hypothetical protein Q7P37_001195 [Cladosporium fusiforme]